MTELDLAIKTNSSGTTNSIYAIVTPARTGTAQEFHYGCVVLQVTSLDTPAIYYSSGTVPQVLALATASDLLSTNEYGPGACSYEPSSNTGLLITRRITNLANTAFNSALQQTGLIP